MSKWLMVFDSATERLKRTLFNMPVADGSAGASLTTDGNGNLSWSLQDLSISSQFLEVTASTQSDFIFAQDTTDKFINVYVNGVLQREGASYDYTRSTTHIVFTSALKQYAVVRLDILSIGTTSIYEYNFDSTASQTTFTADRTLAGRLVQVYRNGILQRAGDAYDYVISGTSVVFNEGLPASSWVRIMLQSQ